MKVKCINGSVDGLTSEKEYDIANVFIRKEGVSYGLTDDHGIYNEYKAERFIFMEDKKINLLTEKNGVQISVLLY